ncbi:pentapeptide repeat-containing protein [Pannus brasiliensis CCIBt3594]|uniref:Pentapeptide repeat-containing protein n=1 Tax=Pannus brasiliensis CCIBt3594 TaxID=1427578 RepID=A0AAW9QPV4_9CHRO
MALSGSIERQDERSAKTRKTRSIVRWFGIVIVCLGFFLPAFPVFAAVERVPLTVEILQEKASAPVIKEGIPTIDLSSFTIDLRDENQEFRNAFYQQLQGQLTRAKQPLGLDFSNSQIQGKFIASRIGLTVPLSKIAVSPLLSPAEQNLLQQDDRFLADNGERVIAITAFRGPIILRGTVFLGEVDFSKSFFLQTVEAIEARFSLGSNWSESGFARVTDFSRSSFVGDSDFSRCQFFNNVRFRSVQFKGTANFLHSRFNTDASFDDSTFEKTADFTRGQWLKNANFVQVVWRDRSLFSKSRFFSLLSFRNSTFERAAAFRSSYFNGHVSFQDVKLLDQVDFSNATFTPTGYISVSGLGFDSDKAKISGDRGEIAKVLYLPTLAGNESVLRNLARNFRSQEQIADENQIKYKTERLRFQQLKRKILDISPARFFNLGWFADLFHLVFLGLLLLLSQDGTNISLIFGTGTIVFAYFSVLFWLLDRFRRLTPKPIVPTRYEIICMGISSSILTLLGVFTIARSAGHPLLTLLAIATILIPIPVTAVIRLYWKGRYHDLIDSSYFVQDGSLRQLRLLITRLPVVPEFPLFRDRYTPVPWDRRWNWLNYYDLSLNNLLKLGFNDWRTRDRELPGIVSFLVWYQWGLGIFYVTLLFWTLSRAIPGLNLLIYLK